LRTASLEAPFPSRPKADPQGSEASARVCSQRPLVARLEGLEPPAHSLEGCCSIRLSYRRQSIFYHFWRGLSTLARPTRNTGILERWNVGMVGKQKMEEWNNATMEDWNISVGSVREFRKVLQLLNIWFH
jgi:hypothetical protein